MLYIIYLGTKRSLSNKLVVNETSEDALLKVPLKFQNYTPFSQRVNTAAYIDSKMLMLYSLASSES